MAQDEQKGRIKNVLGLLSRWWVANDQSEEERDVAAMEHPSEGPIHYESLLSTPERSVDAPSHDGTASHDEISPIVMTISEKLSVLKKSLDFDSDSKSRLDGVHSYRELLLYIYDVLLVRLGKLRDIGMMSSESSHVVDSLVEKLTTMLASQGAPDCTNASERLLTEELRKENEDFRQQLENLKKRYVKSGIISETELSLEQEIRYLQSKVREQQTRLHLAKKKLKALFPYQEMVQTLKAKNSLLSSKAEHQARLLRSLAAKDPKQQELLSTIEKLTNENKRLKTELKRQSELLNQLHMNLPPDSRALLDDLVNQNARLYADLEDRQAQLEGVVAGSGMDENLLESIERLNEENAQLKNTLQAQHDIKAFIETRDGKGDLNELVDTLKMENQRLEVALQAKDEQIKVLTSEPSDRPLMKAYTQLQNQYRQLLKENQTREQLYLQQQEEKKQLLLHVREKTALIKENNQLRAELELRKRASELLRKSELQCVALKKERSEFRSKFESTSVENAHLKQKLAKLSAEYALLIKEYENIFDSR